MGFPPDSRTVPDFFHFPSRKRESFAEGGEGVGNDSGGRRVCGS